MRLKSVCFTERYMLVWQRVGLVVLLEEQNRIVAETQKINARASTTMMILGRLLLLPALSTVSECLTFLCA
jgi:hypothetical protein